MASPQLEKGHTRIANELLEAVFGCYLSSYEKDVLLAIMRKTYGWNKKVDRVSASQLSDLTGIPRPHITRTVHKLLSKKIVTQTGNSLGVQKDYEQWIVDWRKLPKQVTGVTQTGNSELPKQVHTKERKTLSKETITAEADLKVKKVKDMSWKKPYRESEHGDDDLPEVDLESGEVIDRTAQAREKSRKYLEKKNDLIDAMIARQGRDPVKLNRPKQLKALNRLIEMKITAKEAQNLLIELETSDYWRGKIEKPDFQTVVALVEKRG